MGGVGVEDAVFEESLLHLLHWLDLVHLQQFARSVQVFVLWNSIEDVLLADASLGGGVAAQSHVVLQINALHLEAVGSGLAHHRLQALLLLLVQQVHRVLLRKGRLRRLQTLPQPFRPAPRPRVTPTLTVGKLGRPEFFILE